MIRRLDEASKRTPSNGVVGFRLEDGVKIPDSLRDCGAEIMDWEPNEFESAIEGAATASGRAVVAAVGIGGGSSYAR